MLTMPVGAKANISSSGGGLSCPLEDQQLRSNPKQAFSALVESF